MATTDVKKLKSPDECISGSWLAQPVVLSPSRKPAWKVVRGGFNHVYGKGVYYASSVKDRKLTLSALSVRDFMFELRCTSVQPYERLSAKTRIFYLRMIRRLHVPRTKCQVPGIYTAAVHTAAGVVYSTYPYRTAVRKKLTPLESSYGHHLPARAASARANPGGCFNPSERRRHRDAEARRVERIVSALYF